jgi:multiple sugar transport system substrate-binding protein
LKTTLNRRSLVMSVAIVATAALGLTGCATSSATEDPDAPVSIGFSFWGDDKRAEATQQAIDLFEKANPNITVTLSYSDFNSYVQKLTTQVAGGGAPTVYAVPSQQLKQYAQGGQILDLGTLDPTVDVSGIAEQYLANPTIDGKLYGVPLGRAASGFVYNPAVWEAAGLDAPAKDWTWDDFAADAKKISQSTDGATVGVTDFGKSIEWFQIYLISHGKDLYTDEGELGFEQSDLEDFWDLTQGFVTDGLATAAQITTQFDQSMETSPLVKGQSAGELAASSLATAYQAALGSDIAIAPIPSDGKQSGVFAGVTSSAVISAKATEAEQAAAVTFLDFFVNDEAAGKVLGLSRGLPPSQAVTDTISADLDVANVALFDYDAEITDILQPAPPLYPEGSATATSEFTRVYDDLDFGKTSVADAAKQMFDIFSSSL